MLLFFRRQNILGLRSLLSVLVVLFLFRPPILKAADSGKIEQLLNEVKNNSRQFKVSEFEAKADLSTKSKQNLVFETTGYLSGSYLNQDSPPTSPFSTENSSVYEYKAGIEKQWSSGIHSEFSYSLSDTSNSFQNGTNNDFLNPKLQLSLSTNLFQDIVSSRYSHLKEEIASSAKAIEINRKVEQKQTLANSLLAFATLLEKKEERELQAKLCREVKTQSVKLEKKKQRRSIS
ncbi:hypothetical protein N9D31_03655, partial [Oligoflexaceae bacterium]|nr:hypothetical protein [Oligoflexaceae bacterium]